MVVRLVVVVHWVEVVVSDVVVRVVLQVVESVV